MENETKNCKKCKKDFLIESVDFDFYEKAKVPAPTFCPDCRLQRRLLWRNERSFYRRKCNLCSKSIVSTYPENAPFPVYCQKCWWSDNWDPSSYGREYDFSRPFFEQYKELMYIVPMLSMMNDNEVASTGCEYAYDWAFSKNCYMTVCGWYAENISYSYHVNHAKEICDCYHVNKSENMYESIVCYNSSNCKYCMLCFDSLNCIGGFDLRGCSDCVFSVGLRNKKYCIFNEQYTEEEYKKKIQELNVHSREFIEDNWEKFQELILTVPHRYATIFKSVNSTGNFLWNCKNVKDSFYYYGVEDGRFMTVGDVAKDSYDCNNSGNPIMCYESVTPDDSYGNVATVYCWKCREALYSNNCHSSENIFGCSGVKKGNYMIFNKKYSKEEYEELKEKIIAQMKEAGEYGEFFPADLSTFAYNESAAVEWFPLTKEQSLTQGFKWKDEEKNKYQPTLEWKDLPNTIDETNDDILKEIISCRHKGECEERCTTAFKITPQELKLYQRMKVPIPTKCPNCRHYGRLKRRLPLALWHRQCMCEINSHDHDGRCENEFETSYTPERKETVYCEACYQQEVV